MFDLWPGKLSLRREFEVRVWKGDEQFCDYYQEKVILANRIPIARRRAPRLHHRRSDRSSSAEPGAPDELSTRKRAIEGVREGGSSESQETRLPAGEGRSEDDRRRKSGDIDTGRFDEVLQVSRNRTYRGSVRATTGKASVLCVRISRSFS